MVFIAQSLGYLSDLSEIAIRQTKDWMVDIFVHYSVFLVGIGSSFLLGYLVGRSHNSETPSKNMDVPLKVMERIVRLEKEVSTLTKELNAIREAERRRPKFSRTQVLEQEFVYKKSQKREFDLGPSVRQKAIVEKSPDEMLIDQLYDRQSENTASGPVTTVVSVPTSQSSMSPSPAPVVPKSGWSFAF